MSTNSEETKFDKLSEKIGKVTLDYKHYAGRDLYCDGDVEGEILEAVKKVNAGDLRNLNGDDYAQIIEKNINWPFLYHLSPIRENIVNWLDITKEDKVLDVGSGCGAITGALAAKAGIVDCVDLSRQRSLINAYRHPQCDNVTIHLGNFSDIEPDLPSDYTLISLIGVFEYGYLYIGGDNPFETFLNILKKHLAPGGRIVIAIENKFGLKYFAGCKEDHVGKYFEGIEDYPGETPAKTFTENGLLKIAENCGFSRDECQMYYPYPDYKFMNTLFSKERLPQAGELKDNLRNFDRDRLYLFDEKLAFENILREGEFPLFSNSYMLVLGEKPMVNYARFSNDRADDTCIVTEIVAGGCSDAGNEKALGSEDKSGYVIKKALTGNAKLHLKKMADNYEKLQGNSGFAICPCKLSEDGSEISFPIIPGKRLEELLDDKLFKGDKDGFISFFKEFFERVKACDGAPVSNLDLIFSNILVDTGSAEDDSSSEERHAMWTAIDYEWVVEEKVPAKEIAYRALYCYMLEDSRRRVAEEYGLLEILGISAGEAEKYKENELKFQKTVTAGHKSLAEIREKIGNEVIDVTGKMAGGSLENGVATVGASFGKLKVYYDDGSGFSEDKTFYPDRSGYGYEIDLSGRTGIRTLRLDPCDYPCVVKINYLTDSSDNDLSKKILSSSGTKIGTDVYAFGTDDPYFVLPIKDLSGKNVRVSFEISPIPGSIASSLDGPKEPGIFGKISRKLKG
ncbi:MAG: class I SAM-dependent methyltransferase [Lachnospiraceae bacterium]|nr:class I SAM-dependent methyltransferase [Lachnospiraceae bacterium]